MRMPRIYIAISIGFALLALLLIFVVLIEPQASPDDIPHLQSRAGAMINKIEQFKKKNGHYPQTLSEAGTDSTSEGIETRYVVGHDGSSFELVIGNYERNGFVTIWSSSDGTWDVDD